MKIDLSQEPGLALIFKDYQVEAMKQLWSTDSGQSTYDIWKGVNETLLGKTISRASIINFLNAMADDGLLSYEEITGKGGYRRIYSAALTEKEFWTKITSEVTLKLAKIIKKVELSEK